MKTARRIQKGGIGGLANRGVSPMVTLPGRSILALTLSPTVGATHENNLQSIDCERAARLRSLPDNGGDDRCDQG